mgnify:CR=1
MEGCGLSFGKFQSYLKDFYESNFGMSFFNVMCQKANALVDFPFKTQALILRYMKLYYEK